VVLLRRSHPRASTRLRPPHPLHRFRPVIVTPPSASSRLRWSWSGKRSRPVEVGRSTSAMPDPWRRCGLQPAASWSAGGGPPQIPSPRIGAPPLTGEPLGFLTPSTLRRVGFRRRREDFRREAAGHGEEMGQMAGGGTDILDTVRSRFSPQPLF
jgi:hypothetical protein